MFLSDVVRRSSRSLRSAKIRTILTALAIAVGTFALTMTLAASNGVQVFVNNIIAENFDPAELLVAKDEGVFGRTDQSKPQEYDENFGVIVNNAGATAQIKRLDDKDITILKNTEGVDQVREAINVSLQYITRPNQKKYLGTVQAINPAQNPEILAGSIPKPFGDKQVLLPEGYLGALGFKDAQSAVNQDVTLAVKKSFTEADAQALLQQGTLPSSTELQQLSQKGVTEETFKIVGVLKKPVTSQPGTELYLYISSNDSKRLNDFTTLGTANYHKYVFAFVRVKDGTDKAKLTAVQNTIKSKGYSAQSVADTQKFLTQIINILQGIVAAFAAIAIIASVFGVVNTMYISVLQRTREIGLMKALGMRKKDIGRLFRFEAAWIGLLGGLIGSLLAFIAGTLLNPWITTKLELGPGNKLLIFKLPEMIILIAVLMLVATFAGLLPARKAAKLDPIEALRTE